MEKWGNGGGDGPPPGFLPFEFVHLPVSPGNIDLVKVLAIDPEIVKVLIGVLEKEN
jgi:hypothetical protein